MLQDDNKQKRDTAMNEFNKINAQMRFMQNLMDDIQTKIMPRDETMQVFNESIMENNLTKWWAHLDGVEKKKIETRKKYLTDFFDI
jgi:hypothetical protein